MLKTFYKFKKVPIQPPPLRPRYFQWDRPHPCDLGTGAPGYVLLAERHELGREKEKHH